AATQIWFAFYPLGLFRAFQAADDPAQLAQRLLLQGKYQLKDQIDSSHTFLYGHRYWPEVKAAVADAAGSPTPVTNLRLTDQIMSVARRVAERLKAPESLVVGITAVA